MQIYNTLFSQRRFTTHSSLYAELQHTLLSMQIYTTLFSQRRITTHSSLNAEASRAGGGRGMCRSS